jgi:hypothetical protein
MLSTWYVVCQASIAAGIRRLIEGETVEYQILANDHGQKAVNVTSLSRRTGKILSGTVIS